MDYFSFYELPISFSPDINLVRKKFYEFSKKYHPDFYINETEEKQREVLELSTLNNKAYQVLSNPQPRLHYILELKGLVKEGENYKLPQDFLMDMMEINEALMELQFDPDATKLLELKEQVGVIETGLLDELSGLTSVYDNQDPSEREETLHKIKDIYYRNKYLSRIREGLDKASA